MLKILLVSAMTCAMPTFMYARMLDDEPEQIDREEKLNTENYNDEYSYRPPFGWGRIWDNSELAFRTNGGSYNANRFMYEEDIKLRSPLDKPATLSFRQERQHNLLGNFNDREIRVRYNELSPFIPALMADADSWKRSIDFGTSLMWSDDRSYGVEGYAWSVNHLYNQKRTSETQNTVRTPARTIGALAFYKSLPDMSLHLQYEHDRPTEWDRVTDGYNYRYERRLFKGEIGRGNIADGWWNELRVAREYKHEYKFFYLGDDDDLVKKLDLYAHEVEYRLNYAKPGVYDLTQGLVFIERNANYVWQPSSFSGTPISQMPEDQSPNVTRLERAYYLTYYKHLSSNPSLGIQYGLYVNHVKLRKSPDIRERMEVKGQTGFTYAFAKGVESFINATWNLDGIFRYATEDDQPFRPWDGGSIQLIAAF